MQLNTPGTLHCGKLSLNRDRLLEGHDEAVLNTFLENIKKGKHNINVGYTIYLLPLGTHMGMWPSYCETIM